MNIQNASPPTEKRYSFARPSQECIDAARAQRKQSRRQKTAERMQKEELLRVQEREALIQFCANHPAFHPHRMAPVLFGPQVDKADVGLWAGRSELQEVIPGLLISNFFGARDMQRLHSHGITHVLVCANELPEAHPHHFSYLKLTGLTDNTHTALMPHVNKALPWIKQAIATQGRVLIHCASGMSRSGAILTAYLMWDQHLSLQDALEKAKQSRPIVEPNPGFLEQLTAFQSHKDSVSKQS